MKKKSAQLELLKNERIKDEVSLNLEKENFIREIKKFKKEDIVKETKKEELTIWQRIIRVLIN